MTKKTSKYIRDIYNKASTLNRSAARLAMAVFQRRLASSTYALKRSFERRAEKLSAAIEVSVQFADGETATAEVSAKLAAALAKAAKPFE